MVISTIKPLIRQLSYLGGTILYICLIRCSIPLQQRPDLTDGTVHLRIESRFYLLTLFRHLALLNMDLHQPQKCLIIMCIHMYVYGEFLKRRIPPNHPF